MEWGFGPWETLFEKLHNLRIWGPQDRMLPETILYWQKRLAEAPDASVRFEIELWFHESEERRNTAVVSIVDHVESAGGDLVSSAVIQEIRYHGLLVDLPAGQIEILLDNPTVSVARADEIMYLRPQSLAMAPIEAEEQQEVRAENPELPPSEDFPIAALFDGVPFANHVFLEDRLVLDDPEDLAAHVPANKREHGTAMASLILHGDLEAPDTPLGRKLYVRPVLQYDPTIDNETTPPDRLPLDIVYQAIVRMKEGDANTPAVASTVVVVNLSLGDSLRPFAGRISPWARLLDWLSFQYRILFVVSAGNVLSWLPLEMYTNRAAFEAAAPEARRDHIISALNADKANRTLLSPAEGLNAMTVGAWHADGFHHNHRVAPLVDPFPPGSLPNVSSALGLGHRRVIKPDLVYDGGRELVALSVDQGHIWIAPRASARFAGQLAAAPSSFGLLNQTRRVCGTSNAAALITRAAVQLYDSLRESAQLANRPADQVPPGHQAVVLKALLAHAAKWSDSAETIAAICGPHGQGTHSARLDNVARFLGYGRPDIPRILDCTAERATLFGFGELEDDTEDYFEMPLPRSLEGFTEFRRLTVTLAWLSALNPRHQNYRVARLDVLPGGDERYSLAVDRFSSQPNHFAVERGTIYHSVFEGEDAIAFLDEGFLKVRVTCRSQAGALAVPVPYALALSIETAVGSGIDIYQEVRLAIQPRVRARARR